MFTYEKGPEWEAWWQVEVATADLYMAYLACAISGARSEVSNTSRSSYSASVSGLMWRAGVVVLCGGFKSGREPCVAVKEVAEGVELADAPFGGGGQVG